MILTACPLCAADNIAFAFSKKSYDHARCAACGFVFLNPMPAQIQLNEEYQGHKAIRADFYPHAASRRRKAFFRALKLWPYLFRRRVLDIGCGGGFFVNAARHLGACAEGLDVDAASIAYAQATFPRTRFNCASFNTFTPASGYDLVYSSEVIEHVADPHEFMRLLTRVCRAGGHVFITSPDLSSPRVPPYLPDWAGFAPPAHVGLFTRQNLCALFARYGFRVAREFTDRKTGMKILFRRNS